MCYKTIIHQFSPKGKRLFVGVESEKLKVENEEEKERIFHFQLSTRKGAPEGTPFYEMVDYQPSI